MLWFLAYILLGVAVWVCCIQPILWLFVFHLKYKPQLARFFDDIPMMTAAGYEPDPEAEELTCTTADGLTLHASYLRATTNETKGVILFCHELNGDRWNVVPYAKPLRAAGYNVMAVDSRNHGKSDATADYHPLPWISRYEALDIEAAMACLRHHSPDLPIGVMGISRGANQALWVAAESPDVKAVVTDGAFPLLGTLTYSVRRWMRIYTGYEFFFQAFPDWVIDWHLHHVARYAGRKRNVEYLLPERAASRLTQPVLMIHGERDAFIPKEVATRLSRRIRSLVRLWFVPKAKHNQSILTEPDAYGEALVEFLDEHLAAPCSSAAPKPKHCEHGTPCGNA